MTPEELAAALRALGWSGRTLAERLEVDEATVRHWLRGQRMPETVVEWLRGLVAAHVSRPAPGRPGRLRARWPLPDSGE